MFTTERRGAKINCHVRGPLGNCKYERMPRGKTRMSERLTRGARIAEMRGPSDNPSASTKSHGSGKIKNPYFRILET